MSAEHKKSWALSSTRPNKRIFLFDVDVTLTVPRNKVSNQMRDFLVHLRTNERVAIVGGSDLVKQKEQLGDDIEFEWDYVFSENGLVAFKEGKNIATGSIKKHLGEEKLKKFINFCLHYIADLDIPIKRGTFVEFRNGMLNISPIGRNCEQQERVDFEKYDHEHKIRATFVEALRKQFADYNLTYSIGGQISFDVFPNGWDKTYCLQYLHADKYTEVHFFGDKTDKGGNDFEIYSHKDVHGHSVKSPEDTMRLVKEVLEGKHTKHK